MRYAWLILTGMTLPLLTGCEIFSPTEAAIDHYVAGRLAMDRENYQEALAELDKSVRADPKLSIAYASMGDIHRKQGDNLQAADAYEQACQANPYAFRSHYNLGVTYKILSDAARNAKAAGNYLRKAVQVYLRAVMLKPEDFDTNLNLSACYFQIGKYDLAIKYCQSAIKADPKNPFAYSNLGTIYDAQNRHYDAIKAYKDSLELDVHQPMLLLNLGTTYIRLGRHKDALNAFELAAGEDPNCSDAWEQIGACCFSQKKLDEAIKAYRRAIDINGQSAAAHRGLGVVYMTQFVTSGKNTELRDKALSAWNRSLELNSSQFDLLRLVRKYTPKLTEPEL
ncbi:MAG: tetratricopeptide repeat protein [Planctomycetota bacterium]|nr:tetratricopeptide repeat protein [Planctomycetota bacterium]